MNVILGIDNGLSGGIVGISTEPGLAPIFMKPMPKCIAVRHDKLLVRDKTTKPLAKKKASAVNEICAETLKALLSDYGRRDKLVCFFEDCPDHGDRVAVVRSMANTAGQIIAVLKLLQITTYRIQSHTWMPDMLGNVPRGETKAYALKAANAIWPRERWLLTPRCSTPDTGLIDAALIAEWGRRNLHRM